MRIFTKVHSGRLDELREVDIFARPNETWTGKTMLQPKRNTIRLAAASLSLLALLFPGCRWNSTGQNTLGVRLYQQGRYNEALQQFQIAQQSDPSNPDAYYNLAATYHRLGVDSKDANLIEQSESLYNQCLDLYPNHVDCHRGLAVLLVESGRRDKGLLLLTRWAKDNPGLSDARVELARLHQELGDTKLAEQYLDEALAINPNDYRAWTARGQMREAAGDLGQAMQNYQHSLAINGLQGDLIQRTAALNVRIAQNAMAGTLPNQPTGGWTVQNAPSNPTPRY